MNDTRPLRKAIPVAESLGLPLGPLTDKVSVFTKNGRSRPGMLVHDSRYCWSDDGGPLLPASVSAVDGLRVCRWCSVDLFTRISEQWARLLIGLVSEYRSLTSWQPNPRARSKRTDAPNVDASFVSRLQRTVDKIQANTTHHILQFDLNTSHLQTEEVAALRQAALDAIEIITSTAPQQLAAAEALWRSDTVDTVELLSVAAADLTASEWLTLLRAERDAHGSDIVSLAIEAVKEWHIQLGRLSHYPASPRGVADMVLYNLGCNPLEEVRMRASSHFHRPFIRERSETRTTFDETTFGVIGSPPPAGCTSPFEWLRAERRTRLLWMEDRLDRELTLRYETLTSDSQHLAVAVSGCTWVGRGSTFVASSEVLAEIPSSGSQVLVAPAAVAMWLADLAPAVGGYGGVIGPSSEVDTELAQSVLSLWQPGKPSDLSRIDQVVPVARAMCS
jgi:hypothetical protein